MTLLCSDSEDDHGMPEAGAECMSSVIGVLSGIKCFEIVLNLKMY